MSIELRLTKYATISSQAWFETMNDIDVAGHTIPAGLQTDGATQPRWTIATAIILILIGGLASGIVAKVSLLFGVFVVCTAYLVPPFGAYALAAFLHDKLLSEVSREEADKTMKEVLEHIGISGFFSKLLYRLVRVNSAIKDRAMG